MVLRPPPFRGRTPTALLVGIFLIFLLGISAVFFLQRRADRKPGSPRTFTLYAFSIMEGVMSAAILPEFQRQWNQRTGEAVQFITTYAGSGTITDQILGRFPAEVAILSSELDAYRLLDRGIVMGSRWTHFPHGGVVTRSPMLILVRPDNPKGIRGFTDLAGEGLRIIHSDPGTSGCGEWSILAMYGAARRSGMEHESALSLLREIRRNVVAEPSSARHAMLRFQELGADALLSYEAEAIGPGGGNRVMCHPVYPSRSVLSEHIVVRIDRNIHPDKRPMIDAFLEFLWSAEVQASFVDHGFRSVDEELNSRNASFGAIEDLFTLEDLGGVRTARQTILNLFRRNRLLAGLESLP